MAGVQGQWGRRLAAGALAVLFGIVPAGAQDYFGRNKVQYRTFAFQVLQTDHFDIYFYPEERAAVDQAARMAERWYVRLARVLGHELRGAQPLILYASHPDFEQTNAVPGELSEGTGGVTESLKRRIVLPLGGPLAETDHVIAHELVHAFQYDMAGIGTRGPNAGGTGLERLPLWFVEGMAEYLSLGPVDAHTAMWMRDAARQNRMPAIRELQQARYFPYRWGQAFWAYAAGRWGDHVVPEMLRMALASGDYEAAFRRALGIPSADVSLEWHRALRESAAAVGERTHPASHYGQALERGLSEVENLNVSPAISPDGTRMMFLSQRSLVSIDLYLADAHTGRIRRKVVDTAVDPHFSSLEFIQSAGAWAPDNRRFAFTGVRGGRPVLVILDADVNRVERELPFASLGQVFNPSWSPDGRTIVLSAQVGGLTDLFLVDIETGGLTRLTDDPFADLQPAWSPDGRSIAFATDRFSTRLENLEFGNYRLALIDVGTRAVRPIAAAASGKNINPQWASPSDILFVSDRNGISNIYRARVEGGLAAQVTNVTTGVSGITPLSPAFSYATLADRAVFSVYEDGSYTIYGTAGQGVLAGGAAAGLEGLDAARLPPRERAANLLSSVGSNPAFGLPTGRPAKVRAYRPRLALDAVGQPSVGVGVDPYGTYAGGGTSLFWSDMLGNRSLGAAVQVDSGFTRGFEDVLRNTGAEVAYQNLAHRWNWAVAGGQIPLLSGVMSGEITTRPDGTQVGVLSQTIYRQVNRTVSLVTAYPFDRFHRLELSAGYANISFDQRVDRVSFDLVTGEIIGDETLRSPVGAALNIGQASAALVSDTASFGATSPVAGRRYRFQVSAATGSLRMTSAVADYRRYLMPLPFYTVAMRVLHYGRYGRDAQDPRLFPLFLGYADLVRGYDLGSFRASECTATATTSCREFDRLLGSRLLVGNVEFRFPLLRPWGVRPRMYGPVPLEIGVFGDAGVAWSEGERPALVGGGRRGVASAGVALRTNVLGLLVAQIDVVKPFQRPRRGWLLQFSLTPGF